MNNDMCHLWFILISYAHVIVCCRFGSAPNCGFPCRCTGSNQCDPETGVCAPGSECQRVLPDGYGWTGQGCLIGNVAYGKSNVQQSGQYSYYSAELAVDGDTTPYITNTLGESCANPYSDPFAWWWVDLGDIYNIQSITIVNRLVAPGTAQPQSRFNERSTDYEIKIGNTSDLLRQTLCFHQWKIGNEVKPVETMTCNQGDMAGRYVSFIRNGGTTPQDAAICEFIVFGHLVIECSADCDGNCDIMIGCDECKPGKMLPDCTIDCPYGYWGVNCANRCGNCKDDVVCDKVTGSCGDQCDGWYIPDMCILDFGNPPVTTNLIVGDITDNSAVLFWERSTGYDDDTQPYFYYIVRYGANDTDIVNWLRSERIYLSDVQGLLFQYRLTNLEYNTECGVQVTPYGEFNGLTKEGNPMTAGFKTKCIAPLKQPTLSVLGSTEVFKVFWKMIDPSDAGCDHLEKFQVCVECRNSTHTSNKTTEFAPTATEFLYSAKAAFKCTIWLVVSNNEGLFKISDKVTLSVESTQRPDPWITQNQTPSQLAEYRDNNNVEPLNIPAIAIGASLGAMVVGLIIAVILMVLRLRRFHKTTLEDNQKAANPLYEPGKPNPVFDATDGALNNYYNAKYESVDNTRGNRDTCDTELTDRVIYENTETSNYESVNRAQRVTADTVTTVYQELKQ